MKNIGYTKKRQKTTFYTKSTAQVADISESSTWLAPPPTHGDEDPIASLKSKLAHISPLFIS